MRIRNPKFVDPVAAKMAAKKPAVQAFIAAARADAEFLALDDIRAGLPAAAAADLTDGMLHQILLDLGHKVEA